LWNVNFIRWRWWNIAPGESWLLERWSHRVCRTVLFLIFLRCRFQGQGKKHALSIGITLNSKLIWTLFLESPTIAHGVYQYIRRRQRRQRNNIIRHQNFCGCMFNRNITDYLYFLMQNGRNVRCTGRRHILVYRL
jgi:hypothetical protein